MRPWIIALLDPAPIEKANKDKHNTHIQMPPKFDVNSVIQPVLLPPRQTRTRASRSASPSKIATPSRKIATPRKSRKTRKSKADTAKMEEQAQPPSKADSPTTLHSALQQQALENGTTASESVATDSVAPESVAPSVVDEAVNGTTTTTTTDSVRIEVQETVEQNGDVEVTTTNVKLEVPASHPDLPVPENPELMIETARKMVEDAKAGIVEGSGSSGAAEVNGD